MYSLIPFSNSNYHQIPNLPPFQSINNNNTVVPPHKTEGKQLPLPCTVYTFGFGSDHDPNLLKGIADKGSGIYYFIEKTSNISEAFAGKKYSFLWSKF